MSIPGKILHKINEQFAKPSYFSLAWKSGWWSLWTTQTSFPNFAEWQKESGSLGSLPLANSQIWLCFKDGTEATEEPAL